MRSIFYPSLVGILTMLAVSFIAPLILGFQTSYLITSIIIFVISYVMSWILHGIAVGLRAIIQWVDGDI